MCVFQFGSVYALTDISRFYRALHDISYPYYKCTDRDIYFDFLYGAHRMDSSTTLFYSGEYYNIETQYDKDISGKLQFQNRYIKIKPRYRLDYLLSLTGTGISKVYSRIDETKLYSTFESSSERHLDGNGQLTSNISYEQHFGFRHFKGVPFIKVNFDNNFSGRYERSDDYREENDYMILSKERSKHIYNRMKFYPEIGVNNQKPVAPIYRAFEIERKLRKSKVITDRLSKKTIESLAHIAASQEKYRITHERYAKYMMSDLEAALKVDSSIDTTLLRAFSLFKAEEVLTNNAPELYCGFRAGLRNELGYSASYNSYNQHKGNDNPNHIVYRARDLFWSPFILTVACTYPIINHLFFDCSMKSNFDYQNHHSFTQQISDIKSTFGLYYFFNDRITLKGYVVNLPIKDLLPSGDKPDALECSLSFYIEDNINLNLSFEKRYSIYNYYYSYKKVKCEDDMIRLGVNYDF